LPKCLSQTLRQDAAATSLGPPDANGTTSDSVPLFSVWAFAAVPTVSATHAATNLRISIIGRSL
jgi:hypothetical protein